MKPTNAQQKKKNEARKAKESSESEKNKSRLLCHF